MLGNLISQLLNIPVKAEEPICPMCNKRPRHRTAINERLTSYCIQCHKEIKRNAQKQKI